MSIELTHLLSFCWLLPSPSRNSLLPYIPSGTLFFEELRTLNLPIRFPLELYSAHDDLSDETIALEDLLYIRLTVFGEGEYTMLKGNK